MDKPIFPRSLPEFQKLFPDETACASYMEYIRWPRGFVCPHDGDKSPPYRFRNRLHVLRCRACKRDISLTAKTVMDHSHTPLCVWFWSAYLVTTQTPGVSALQLGRQLGITRYETSFQILHKLRAGMIRPNRDKIGGSYPTEIDETFVGGRTRGSGKGVHHKAVVIGAVEVHSKRKPGGRRDLTAGKLRLRMIPNRGSEAIEAFVLKNVKRDTVIRTDGWHGYSDLGGMGYRHAPEVVHGDPERTEAHLPMIHIVFSNLKTWLLGTHHGVSQQHLQAYLNEFTFRFNRRFYPMTSFHTVLGISAQAHAPTYAELYGGKWKHPNPTGEDGMQDLD